MVVGVWRTRSLRPSDLHTTPDPPSTTTSPNIQPHSGCKVSHTWCAERPSGPQHSWCCRVLCAAQQV